MTRLDPDPGAGPRFDPGADAVPSASHGTGPGADQGDPDPTPTATPWQEYFAAAQSLDAVRREAAAEAAALTRAASTARAELAAVSADLARQRAALAQLGVAPQQLAPGPAEQGAATATVTGDLAAVVPEALRQCRQLVEAADAQLTGAPPDRSRRRWWWPFSR
jgi:hypothetical protein